MATAQSHIFEAEVKLFTAARISSSTDVLLEPCADADMDAKLKKGILLALFQANKYQSKTLKIEKIERQL